MKNASLVAWATMLSSCAMGVEEGSEFSASSPEVGAAVEALCSNPQSPDAFPSDPVPVTIGHCRNYQFFEAYSPSTSYGTCGFTVTFGPMGNLLHPASYDFHGRWSVPPTNATACAAARTNAIAFGYRCFNEACTSGAWEQIGTEKSRSGFWNTVSNVCYTEVAIATPKMDYKTVSVSVSAHSQVGTTKTPRHAYGSIRGSWGNGTCFSASVPVRPDSP